MTGDEYKFGLMLNVVHWNEHQRRPRTSPFCCLLSSQTKSKASVSDHDVKIAACWEMNKYHYKYLTAALICWNNVCMFVYCVCIHVISETLIWLCNFGQQWSSVERRNMIFKNLDAHNFCHPKYYHYERDVFTAITAVTGYLEPQISFFKNVFFMYLRRIPQTQKSVLKLKTQ